MRMFENEWYYENTAGIILRDAGVQAIESNIADKSCKQCGGKLSVATPVEGAYIFCRNEWNHSPGWSIVYPPNYDQAPTVKEGY